MHITDILEVTKLTTSNHRMHNLYAIFAKFHDIYKQFVGHLVNEYENMPRRGHFTKVISYQLLIYTNILYN